MYQDDDSFEDKYRCGNCGKILEVIEQEMGCFKCTGD